MPGKREDPRYSGRGSGRSDARSRASRDAYFEEDDYRGDSRSRRGYDYEEDYDDDYADRRRSTGASGRSGGQSASGRSGSQGGRRPAPSGRSGQGGGRSGANPPRNNPPHGKKGKKRRMPRWQKVIITVLIVILLLLVTAVALVWTKLNRIDRIGDESRIDTSQQDFDQDAEGDDTLTDSAVNFGDGTVLENEKVINILLIGRDSRETSERGRSDSMIVMSLNRTTQQISMVSLMRDSYVQIPGYSNNKLNSAFSFGGYELMDETISQNYGINIDYNVGVNFSGFEQVVDQLGGIDITLTQGEAEYLMADEDTLATGLVEGVNHLSGKEALGYARARYVSTGAEANDFGRTYRQRVVMTTVYKELMQKSLPEIWTILDSIMDCVETDMTNAQMVSIGTEFYNMGIDSLQSYRLPCDNEYSDETINKMAVLVLDWDLAQQHLQDWLYSDTPVEDHSLDTAN